ncbi:hypothetical protein [Nostoc sp. C052]|nr:hypothetical protein [Nostoc sp. C052]
MKQLAKTFQYLIVWQGDTSGLMLQLEKLVGYANSILNSDS